MKKKLGVMTVDMLLALLLMSSVFSLFLQLSAENNIQQEAKLVAEQMTFMGDVVKNMVRGESTRILEGTTVPKLEGIPGTTVGGGTVLNLSEAGPARELVAKYLPAGMTEESLPKHNIWWGAYRVLLVRKPYFALQDGVEVPKPELDTLTAVVYTVDDKDRKYGMKSTNEFLHKTNMRAARLLGALGGYSRAGSNVLSGIGWEYAGLDKMSQGNLGIIASYNEDAGGGPFLYRVDVGDPTLNTMQTSINMDHNDLNKVRSLHLENDVPVATWENDCKNNTLTHKDGRVETDYDNEGRIFFVSNNGGDDIELERNGMAICRRGKDGNRSLAFIGDTHTGDQIKYITLASDGQKLPKPLCSRFGGITGNTTADDLEARIFVLPQVFNNGPDSRVIHAVNAYATDDPADPQNWIITLNVLTQENGIRKWTMVQTPPNSGGMAGAEENIVDADFLKVVVVATCSGKREAF